MGGPVGTFTDRPSPVEDDRICFSKTFNNLKLEIVLQERKLQECAASVEKKVPWHLL